MAKTWTRLISPETPLPQTYEYSLSVALVGSQSRATLSIRSATREIGVGARYRPLLTETVEEWPGTYREALLLLQETVVRALARLDCEGLG